MKKIDDQKYMRLAIDEAMKSNEPLKCGVVVVHDGRIIAKTYNSQRSDNNATAHAEIKAIAQAGQMTKSKYLENSDIYCTCEPCVMCLAAISFARIRRLLYGVSLKDVSSKDRLINIGIDEFFDYSPYKLKVIPNFLEDECWKLYKNL